jgi:hypothetical protein
MLVVGVGGGSWWREHFISDFVAQVLATSSLVSLGGGWCLEHCISDFVAQVSATSSLMSIGATTVATTDATTAAATAATYGNHYCHNCCHYYDILQEAKAWLTDRFNRLEAVVEHSEGVVSTALELVRTELRDIRQARLDLGI